MEQSQWNPNENFRILKPEESSFLRQKLLIDFVPKFLVGKSNFTILEQKTNIMTAIVLLRYIDEGLIYNNMIYECLPESDIFTSIEQIRYTVETPLFITKKSSEKLRKIIEMWNRKCLPHVDFLTLKRTISFANSERTVEIKTYDLILNFNSSYSQKHQNREVVFLINREEAIDLLEAMATTDPYNNNRFSAFGMFR